MTRNISILTVGRSDFGRYFPILSALKALQNIKIELIASGSHHSPKFGMTVNEIAEKGFKWAPGMENSPVCNSPSGVGKSVGFSSAEIAKLFSKERPDLLVILGDRFEMLGGAIAAMGFNIPVVHIHGGAITEGAIDELVRHALTKMSHLHLVSCDQYAKRVCQMGEEKWRVHVTGAPGLDELSKFSKISLENLSQYLKFDLKLPYLLVCLHPITIEGSKNLIYAKNLIKVLKEREETIILTYPNSDPGSHEIINTFEAFAKEGSKNVKIFKNVGAKFFGALLNHAQLLIGNSSSGIVEAATFKLPVINMGARQDGKVKPDNVIDCDFKTNSIRRAMKLALSEKFRCALSDLVNPYGDGTAGQKIAKIIAEVPINTKLLHKKFIDQ